MRTALTSRRASHLSQAGAEVAARQPWFVQPKGRSRLAASFCCPVAKGGREGVGGQGWGNRRQRVPAPPPEHNAQETSELSTV